jgi:hypothetical protein
MNMTWKESNDYVSLFLRNNFDIFHDVIKEGFSFTKTFKSFSDISYSHTEEYGRFSKNTVQVVVYYQHVPSWFAMKNLGHKDQVIFCAILRALRWLTVTYSVISSSLWKNIEQKIKNCYLFIFFSPTKWLDVQNYKNFRETNYLHLQKPFLP